MEDNREGRSIEYMDWPKYILGLATSELATVWIAPLKPKSATFATTRLSGDRDAN